MTLTSPTRLTIPRVTPRGPVYGRAYPRDVDGMPPHPLSLQGAPIVATLPPPPRLGPFEKSWAMTIDTLDDRVRLLAIAYRAAVGHRWGTACYALKAVPPSSKWWGVLLRAAEYLEDHGIPPHAWCLYATRRWVNARRHSKRPTQRTEFSKSAARAAREANDSRRGMGYGVMKGKADPELRGIPLPPPSVVFGEKGLREKLRDEKSITSVLEYAPGGRILHGTASRALMKRWAACEEAIAGGMARDDAAVEYWLGTTFEEMVGDAQGEARVTLLEQERRVWRADFIW